MPEMERESAQLLIQMTNGLASLIDLQLSRLTDRNERRVCRIVITNLDDFL